MNEYMQVLTRQSGSGGLNPWGLALRTDGTLWRIVAQREAP
jgi:hypothetical protein